MAIDCKIDYSINIKDNYFFYIRMNVTEEFFLFICIFKKHIIYANVSLSYTKLILYSQKCGQNIQPIHTKYLLNKSSFQFSI